MDCFSFHFTVFTKEHSDTALISAKLSGWVVGVELFSFPGTQEPGQFYVEY